MATMDKLSNVFKSVKEQEAFLKPIRGLPPPQRTVRKGPFHL